MYLKQIAINIALEKEDALILKGASALALAYDSDRLPIDLEYDTLEFNDLFDVLADSSMDFAKENYDEHQNITIKVTCDAKKDEALYRVHLQSKEEAKTCINYRPLKVHIAFRPDNVALRKEIRIQNEIYTYNPQKLIDWKLQALTGTTFMRGRQKFMDFYDANFICHKYPDLISEEKLHRMAEILSSCNLSQLIDKLTSETKQGDNVHSFRDVNVGTVIYSLYKEVRKLHLQKFGSDPFLNPTEPIFKNLFTAP
jgi:hypothetical protein